MRGGVALACAAVLAASGCSFLFAPGGQGSDAGEGEGDGGGLPADAGSFDGARDGAPSRDGAPVSRCDAWYDNPELYLPFDESAVEQLGQSTATVTEEGTVYLESEDEPPCGKALRVKGEAGNPGNHLEIPESGYRPDGAAIFARVFPFSLDSGETGAILSKDDQDSNDGDLSLASVYAAEGEVRFVLRVQGNGDEGYHACTSALPAGAWYELWGMLGEGELPALFVRRQGESQWAEDDYDGLITFFSVGRECADAFDAGASANLELNEHDIWIGEQRGSPGKDTFFEGRIDELQLYTTRHPPPEG